MAEIRPVAPDEAISVEERLDRRAQIAALEAHMLGMDKAEQLSIEGMTDHFFTGGGVYARQMRIPKGVIVVGKLHKTEHLAVLLKGSVKITTEDGTVELDAPQVMVAPPGIKRVAYALTDCVWLSVHSVGEERDLEKIEASLIAPSFEELERASPAAALSSEGD